MIPTARPVLEEWTPIRDSVIWRFNRLFWERVADWEAASGRGFEEALPSGRSDASRPEAVADAVADFWTLLRDLEKKGQLPPELFTLEIGVGSGQRAALWLDRFRALDEERGTSYYLASASSWGTTRCPPSTARWRRCRRIETSSA